MIPPEVLGGKVEWICPSGEYNIDEPLIEVWDANQNKRKYKMSHLWPVRKPRPV